MQANDVYEAVPRSMLPKATRLLRSMVIFKKKIDDKGRVTKYKARWVAKGYSQTKGVNYQETFAPTATATAIRTMLAMAVARGMGIQQMDVNTAFLNAPIDHEIYVEPPRGADIVAPGSVLRLKRGLYGLKQSPRLWNQTLDEWMRSQGFTATATDACIYTRRSAAGTLVWVAVYVDDLLIMADSDKDMYWLNRWQMFCASFSFLVCFFPLNHTHTTSTPSHTLIPILFPRFALSLVPKLNICTDVLIELENNKTKQNKPGVRLNRPCRTCNN